MENGQKIRLTHHLGCKILAAVLLLASVLAGVGAALGLSLALNDNWYGTRMVSFYESSFCENRAYNDAWEAMQTVEYDKGWRDRWDARYTNFLFVVREAETGRVVAQNCDGEPGVYLEQVHPEYTADLAYEGGELQGLRYTIDCYIQSPMVVKDAYYYGNVVFTALYGARDAFLPVLLVSALLFLASLVLLVCGAGRKAGVPGVHLSWVNRKIPFDLYLVFWALVTLLPVGLLMDGLGHLLGWAYSYLISDLISVTIIALLIAAVAGHLTVCIAARAKAGAWWRNTVIWRLLGLLRRMLYPLWDVLRNLNLVWKSALALGGMMFLQLLLVLAANARFFGFVLLLLCDLVLLAVILFAALQLRRLQKGGQALAAGDLGYRLDTRGMYWDFKKHGENLNSISAGMNAAMEERLKSERFKTELITNVSHDIKTPLTSIVSYVDLMKKEPVESEKLREYIDVLDRQSARLKKLTEDLVEASKASCGAIAVHWERVCVRELLEQAVGEYRDRFRAADIQPMITGTEEKLTIPGDGRLLWRVFDNLLSNVCKYSQPGTRVYLSLDEDEERVWIHFKNISREVLNISAEELQERFVRGDSSRHTEGSGLGLSIARSLTELQGGLFRLFVDGDLFKVMLMFPKNRN